MASQGRGAKVKGSGYELKMAKKFGPWWGGTFHRVPGSGSLHWGDDNRVAGDIAAPQGLDFPFVIECKKHEGWTMDHVLMNIGDPKGWWEQVVTDARRVKHVPMLIFSRNRAKDYVMVPHSTWLYLKLESIAKENMKTTVTIKNIRDELQHFDVIVTTFDLISQVDPAALRTYAETIEWDPYKDQYE
jgi:hypothetical protein